MGEGAADEIDLVFLYFVVKVNAAAEIDIARGAFGFDQTLKGGLRVTHLGTQAVNRDFVAGCDDDGPLDNMNSAASRRTFPLARVALRPMAAKIPWPSTSITCGM